MNKHLLDRFGSGISAGDRSCSTGPYAGSSFSTAGGWRTVSAGSKRSGWSG